MEITRELTYVCALSRPVEKAAKLENSQTAGIEKTEHFFFDESKNRLSRPVLLSFG